MRDALVAALGAIWQISKVDLETGVPFSFLGLEIERRHSGDLKIHQTTFTKQLMASYGFDTMTKPMLHVQVTHPADDDGPPDVAELKVSSVVSSTGWLHGRDPTSRTTCPSSHKE